MDQNSVNTPDEESRAMRVLEGLFQTALESSLFDAICTILRVEGMSDANWDPFEESRRAFKDFIWILSRAVVEGTRDCQRGVA